MTVAEEIKDARDFLEKIEKELENEDICAMYAMELASEEKYLREHIESLESNK